MASQSEQQKKFMKICGMPHWTLQQLVQQGMLTDPKVRVQIKLWKSLIIEEVINELFGALDRLNLLTPGATEEQILDILTAIADGIVDGKYVLDGLGNCLSIPLDDVFQEVQRTNMAKAIEETPGNFIVKRRPDGKIMKPEGWTAPDIHGILKNAIDPTYIP